MEESPGSTPTTAPSPYNDQVVSLLCQREESGEDPLPAICYEIFDNYMAKLEENLTNQNSSYAVYSEIIAPNPFLKVLSMLGIFTGVVVTLALLVHFTCVRQRKGVEEFDDSQSLSQYNVQIIEPEPPDYATVVRKEEEELPSYSEAIKSGYGGIDC